MQSDVLEGINTRISAITRVLLGNLEHAKIKIFCEDTKFKKLVDTTIWAVKDKNLMLKHGVIIPFHRICKRL